MTDIERHPVLPSTILQLTQGPASVQLVFFPDVGGNLIYTQPLVRLLDGKITGLGMRVAPDMAAHLSGVTVENAAQRFASDIVEARLNGPVHLVGFSFAALFAAETARQLSIAGHPAARLWILDMPPRPHISPKRRLRHVYMAAARMLSRQHETDVLHRMGFIRMDLVRYPASYRDVIRHFYEILTNFRPHPWKGNVTVVRTRDTHNLRSRPDDLGWSRYIDGDVSTHVLPGDHMSVLNDPANVSDLAELIRAQFARDGGQTDPSTKSIRLPED